MVKTREQACHINSLHHSHHPPCYVTTRHIIVNFPSAVVANVPTAAAAVTGVAAAADATNAAASARPASGYDPTSRRLRLTAIAEQIEEAPAKERFGGMRSNLQRRARGGRRKADSEAGDVTY